MLDAIFGNDTVAWGYAMIMIFFVIAATLLVAQGFRE
jgi:hypothetical protein